MESGGGREGLSAEEGAERGRQLGASPMRQTQHPGWELIEAMIMIAKVLERPPVQVGELLRQKGVAGERHYYRHPHASWGERHVGDIAD